jgi:cellulose synthase/poly-beta-1,6-N-acetylglucosamine synthase-like glycosyltransferase
MRAILGVAALVLIVPGAATALYVTTLALASVFYREPRPKRTAPLRFLVMIPARNEEAVIGGALDAIGKVLRPRDTVLVVADRCSDATADIARSHGVLVLERPDGAEAGRAASLRDGLAWSRTLEWDAVVFLDADTTVIEPGFFEACERVLATGAPVAQARAEAERREGYLAQISAANSAMNDVVVPRGRDRLRGWVRLKGCGMVLRRDITDRFTFHASGMSEDAHLSLELCLAGVGHRLIDRARIRFQTPAALAVASGQKLRYETGRMHLARSYVGRLMRHHSRAAIDAAVFLATPPLAFAVLLLVVGAGLAALAGWTSVAIVALILVAIMALDEVIALIEAKAGPKVWLALLLAPAFVLWKGWIQLRALVQIGSAERAYEPTPRV